MPVGSSARISDGFADDRARHGDPLLLAAGQHRRAVLVARSARPTASSAASARRAPLGRSHARVRQRQLDVLQRGRAGQQVEALEDEADLAVADHGELVLVEQLDVDAVEQVAPRVGMSRQPMMFISVLLPEPDAPMIAT